MANRDKMIYKKEHSKTQILTEIHSRIIATFICDIAFCCVCVYVYFLKD